MRSFCACLSAYNGYLRSGLCIRDVKESSGLCVPLLISKCTFFVARVDAMTFRAAFAMW